MSVGSSKVAVFLVRLMVFFFISQWPFFSFANKETRAVKKVGRHLEKIHKINYKYSLMRSGADQAAMDMYREVTAIRQQYAAISDTAPLKIPLGRFLDRWNKQEVIRASLLDGKQEFLAEANSFYLRGLVKRQEESKTLFPLFRP